MSNEEAGKTTQAEGATRPSLLQTLSASMRSNIRQYTMFIALLFIWMIFTALTGGIFITPRNLSNLFLQTCTIAIISVGMVMVIVGGHIDLSVGSVAGFVGAVAAVLMVNQGLNTIVVIVITLCVGAAIGAWQGFWIAYRDVPSFIVTLSSMLLFRGGIIGVTGGNSIGPMNKAFKALGQGYVGRMTGLRFHDTTVLVAVVSIVAIVYFAVRRRVVRRRYGLRVLPIGLELARVSGIVGLACLFFGIMAAYMGMPYSIMILAAIVLIFNFITQKTTFGRHIYAMGGNKEAARLSGINIRRKTLAVFILMGLLTTVAGMIFTARLNAATPQAGNLFELDAIAACIIGGASIQGGEGSVIGAIVGALVMASLDNGMSLLNLNAMFQYVIKGLILLFAVWIDISTRSKA